MADAEVRGLDPAAESMQGIYPSHTSPAEVSEKDRAMTLHPAVVLTAMIGWLWALACFWVIAFVHGSGLAEVAMVMVTLISLIMFAMMAGCGWSSRNVAERGNTRLRAPESFREFLAGDTEIGGERMKGSEIYTLVLAMAITLAIMGTGLAVGIGVA